MVARRLQLVGVVLGCALRAEAVEVESELAGGRDFVYATTDLRYGSGRLAIDVGHAMACDLRTVRHGARAGFTVELEPVTLGVRGGWAPRQEQRGWLEGALTAGVDLGERVRVELEGELVGRATEGELGRRSFEVAQLQGRGSLLVTWGRVRVGAWAMGSGWWPDLARPSLRGADASFAISVGGQPERWAAALRGGVRLGPVWLDAETGAMEAASGSFALLPRVAARVHAGAGLSFELAAQLALPTDEGELRGALSLAVAWEGP